MPRFTSKLSATGWLAIGAAIALAAVVTFLELAEDVAEQETHELDVAVLQWMDARRTPALNAFFGAITLLGSWQVITGLTLAVCLGAALQRMRRTAATLAIAVLGIYPLNVLLKPLYARPRPDVVAHLDFVDSASFPSGHTLAASVFFGTLALIASRTILDDVHRALIMSGASIVIVLVALSRVYLGVHYPSDVFGGVLVGTTWSLLVLLGAHLYSRFAASR